MIELSYKQLKWLSRHARDIDDVYCDDIGFFVYMSGNSQIKGLRTINKIYLPK